MNLLQDLNRRFPPGTQCKVITNNGFVPSIISSAWIEIDKNIVVWVKGFYNYIGIDEMEMIDGSV